jgi:D-inositol-3-phosphate glycosyltransferase
VQEAMSSGLPVVTSDDPGYAPYELDRDLVALVPRRAEAVRAALSRIAGSAARREGMAQYSRSYAEKYFAWDEHVTVLIGRYRSAASAGPR